MAMAALSTSTDGTAGQISFAGINSDLFQAIKGFVQELEDVEAEFSVVEAELHELLTRQSSLSSRRAELQALIDQNKEGEKKKKAQQWEATDFPWTSDLHEKLSSVFKLSSLRPMQRQTMNATLAKEDTLLIMPTGGGKSLCFQLPALVDKGLTLVVSPLVALMEDQVMALEQLGVSAAMLNASSTKEDVKFVQDDMVNERGKLKLLYVTPEKLAKSKRFMNRLEKCYSMGRLARIAIDEVHCCSQWGHDFRPDYKFLGIMKRQFPSAPILGLTATATAAVLEDVKKILNIPGAFLFKASFNRPNLYYEVRQKPSSQKETMDELYHLIFKRFHKLSGIVYCFSRKETEEVTMDLMSRGIKACCYHADMDAKSRSRVHRQWLSGQVQVVVATVAFGMGIDKPDVRFVIHHSISKSMENLYQESGRAGRDDERADCIVMYRFADVARQSSMVFTEQTGLQKLHGIVKYCTDLSSCRRCMLASHFGEVWDSSHCNNMCDHCELNSKKGVPKARDVTKYCQDVLAILDSAAATEQRVTSAKLIDAWFGRGASTLKVKSVSVPSIDKDTAERVLAHMLIKGYIQEDFHFTAYSTICYIVAGARAANLLRRNAVKIHMEFRSKSQSTSLTYQNTSAKAVPSSAMQSSSTSPNLSLTQRLSSSGAPDSHGYGSPSKIIRNSTAAKTSCKNPVSKSSLDPMKDSPPTKSAERKPSNPHLNGKYHLKEEKRKAGKGDLSSDAGSSLKDPSLRVKSVRHVDVCSAQDKNNRIKNSSSTPNSLKEGGKDCLEGSKLESLKQEKPQTTLKRDLVFNSDSDDEGAFIIKRPRHKNAAKPLSIVISDDSDSENGD